VTKILYCGEVFAGCYEGVTGATEQEVMALEAEHASRSHGVKALGPDLQRRIAEKIRTRPPGLDDVDKTVIGCGVTAVTPEAVVLGSSLQLAALSRAGTRHVYADTADADELAPVLSMPGGEIMAEVDGTTINQPLVHRVLRRYLGENRLRACAVGLLSRREPPGPGVVIPYLYTVLCGWIGRDLVARFAGQRRWDVSLQLHMRAVETSAALATRLGRCLAQMVPSCLVKVPFKPQAPHCLLVARDLEREGIAVNLTSTFSARQVMAAALLTDASRTNVFLGRVNQGLHAGRLGEHVVLEAQRALVRLRAVGRTKTRLIAASMRDWHTFLLLAGCDAFTAPPAVLADFVHQTEVPAALIESRLATSYADDLGISAEVQRSLGREPLRRLWQIEPEFLEFLEEYGASVDYRDLEDGDGLARRFESAGFGDFFYAPDPHESEELARSKLPDLDAPLTRRLALDTLYSLLADADFEKEQAAIDRSLVPAVAAAA
jgi:transaldolase